METILHHSKVYKITANQACAAARPSSQQCSVGPAAGTSRQQGRPDSKAPLSTKAALASQAERPPQWEVRPGSKATWQQGNPCPDNKPARTARPPRQQSRPGSKVAQAVRPPWQQGHAGNKVDLAARLSRLEASIFQLAAKKKDF